MIDSPDLGPDGRVNEEEFTQKATLASNWTGSRLFVISCTFLYASFIFAYFYLRSLNSYGLWKIPHNRPPMLLGTTIAIVVVASALLYWFIALRRLRSGLQLDWFIGGAVALGLGVLGLGLQIWQLTRLPFGPGESGFSSVFTAWMPVHCAFLFCGMYWLETLLARSARVRSLSLVGRGVTAAEQARLESSAEMFGFFWNFMALMAIVIWVLFYVL